MSNARALAQHASISPTMRNRIINGAMMIDQRNTGASVTPTTSAYTLDRWRAGITVGSKFSVQQSSTAPNGFTKSALITSLSAYSVAAGDILSFQQFIEGNNIADLGWGTANAQTVTLSFWVRSSLTGTFGGALSNDAGNRSYPFTYTISAANTWEQKSITIAGDTSGTWETGNLIGIQIRLGLGVGTTYSGTAGAWAGSNFFSATGATSVVGTNGATFYITGVQLEKGSTATSFDYRPYGTELALCQRYYEKSYLMAQAVGTNSATGNYRVFVTPFSGSEFSAAMPFQVRKRSTPTMSYFSDSGVSNSWVALPSTSSRTIGNNDISESWFLVTVSGVTTDATLQGHWAASAEL